MRQLDFFPSGGLLEIGARLRTWRLFECMRKKCSMQMNFTNLACPVINFDHKSISDGKRVNWWWVLGAGKMLAGTFIYYSDAYIIKHVNCTNLFIYASHCYRYNVVYSCIGVPPGGNEMNFIDCAQVAQSGTYKIYKAKVTNNKYNKE